MLKYRHADYNDIDLVFEWSNDPEARRNSYNTDKIPYENHIKWFNKQLNDDKSIILIFEYNSVPVGLVRFINENDNWVVGINIDKQNRKKGYAKNMLIMAAKYLFDNFDCEQIIAYIKRENIASKRVFEKAGYKFSKALKIENIDSYEYKLTRYDI